MAALPLAFEVTPGGEALRFGDRTLPASCSVRARTGRPCPTCGLSRSVVALAHGDLCRSRELHPGGTALYGFVLLQLGARAGFALGLVRSPDWRLDTFLSLGLLLAACAGSAALGPGSMVTQDSARMFAP